DGRNVARRGKANQKNTSKGGDAAKAIDGNKAQGGQTYTEEDTANPWWEVDLGQEFPIDSIVVYNRTDEDLGKRLTKFTLKVLDQGRNVVFQGQKQPAPVPSATFEVGGGPAGNLRRAAM